MPYVVQSQVMHDQRRPVLLGKLVGNVSSHIMIYFREVLREHKLSSNANSVNTQAPRV
jgi:hypothetical protein